MEWLAIGVCFVLCLFAINKKKSVTVEKVERVIVESDDVELIKDSIFKL